MQELRLAFRGARVGALVLAFLAAGLAFPGVAASETSINDRVLVEEGGKLFVQAGGRRFEVSDVVTVKFPPGTPRSAKGSFSADRGAKIIRENRLGYVDLQVPSGKTAVEFAAELESTGALELVEINTIGEYLATPDDTLFDYQWGLNNTGQTGGTPDADIDAPEAWDLEIGSPDVIVAVLDSGTEILHEDLECNIWVNPGEDLDNDGVVWDPDDMNDIDDDGNGPPDYLNGWYLGNNNTDPRSGTNHGTHVAGIVGACGGNATGIIGVAGGLPAPGSRLMPLAVGDFSPDGAVLDDAILHAADMGAHVITLSLTGPPDPSNR
jgi:subtilisin family serine protease